jgi:hypothetical protein
MSAASDLGTEDEIRQLLEKIPQLRAEIAKVIIGQQGVIEELLTAFIAGGHCLLEGPAGLGQDAADPHPRGSGAVNVSSHPVHARPDAIGHHRH